MGIVRVKWGCLGIVRVSGVEIVRVLGGVRVTGNRRGNLERELDRMREREREIYVKRKDEMRNKIPNRSTFFCVIVFCFLFVFSGLCVMYLFFFLCDRLLFFQVCVVFIVFLLLFFSGVCVHSFLDEDEV